MTELWEHVWRKLESMANETFLKPSERHGLPYTRGQSGMLQAGKDVREGGKSGQRKRKIHKEAKPLREGREMALEETMTH